MATIPGAISGTPAYRNAQRLPSYLQGLSAPGGLAHRYGTGSRRHDPGVADKVGGGLAILEAETKTGPHQLAALLGALGRYNPSVQSAYGPHQGGFGAAFDASLEALPGGEWARDTLTEADEYATAQGLGGVGKFLSALPAPDPFGPVAKGVGGLAKLAAAAPALVSKAAPIRVASRFSGAGTTEGAMANATSVHATEFDPDVNRAFNAAHGTDYEPRDVLDASPQEIIAADADHYHASPVCKNFSCAKVASKVEKGDLDAGESVARDIREARPPSVTIENVPEYQETVPFQQIRDAVEEGGYKVDVVTMDAADLGAPMHRDRMILRAVRSGDLPDLPPKQPETDWYETIEDLVDDAPDDVFRGKTKGATNREFRQIQESIQRFRDSGGKAGLDPSKPIITMGHSANKKYPYAANAGGAAPTLASSPGAVPRIILPDGRVKRVTPEMMRRLMGLPESFQIPDDWAQAKTVLGNGIHGETTRQIIEPVARAGQQIRAASRDVSRPGGLALVPNKTRTTESGLPAYLPEDIRALSGVPNVPQRKLPRADLPELSLPLQERVEELYSPANVENVTRGMERGIEMGGPAWYNLEPIRMSALDVLGPEQGQEAFRRLALFLGATSPRSAVQQNIRRASLGHYLAAQGRGFPDDARKLFPGYGHLSQKVQQPHIERAMAGVAPSPVAQPKITSFGENLGGNQATGTIDTHNAMQSGWIPPGKTLNTSHYPILEDFNEEIGGGLGLTPAQAQASQWMGMADVTGVADARIFMNQFNDTIARTSKRLGVPQKDVLKKFWRGEIPLFGVAGAITLGELMGNDQGPASEGGA